MPGDSHGSHVVTLSLSRAEAWTLHHVLLDWLDQDDPSTPADATPPPGEVRAAFETLEAGETSFTVAQLAAIQPILAAYHHAPAWEPDRARLEQLLGRVADSRNGHHSALPSDRS